MSGERRERRALRRAERAQGMDRETRDRTNALVKSINLPAGRHFADPPPKSLT